ncbi:MAG: HAD family hydrolase [Saprospiraceae bacterium]|nr:HAD family hydrolase [Saprospiraceae bacterium]
MDIYKDYDTLFLDRDGTINRRIVDGYVTSWEEFEFLPGVLEALYRFSQHFDPIIIVTNQQGIGREIMTHEELALIHNKMLEKINENKGRIDQIYYCPQLKVFNPLCRKPNPGMAMQAQEDNPSIDFNRSIMIGDTDSDIQFGKNLGMLTVRISNNDSEVNVSADITVSSLLEFSKWNLESQ